MASLSLVWEVHSKSIIAVVVLAIVFRIVSRLVNKAASKRFKTADEVQVATYRVVGLMHHIVQVPLAAAVLSDPAMWENRLFSATPLSTVMLVISAGYFLHDFIQCIEHVAVQGFSYVIHGAGCATVYLFALLHVPSMIHFYGAGFLMWEISSFPVHFRWFFFKLKASQLVQNINGLALLFSFFFARIVWGFWLSYLYWNDIYEYQAAHTPDKQMSWVFVYTTFAANLALNALNTYWFSLIFGKAANAILGRQKDTPGKRD